MHVHAHFPGFSARGDGRAPGRRLSVPASVQRGASRGLTRGEAGAQPAAEGRGAEARAEPTGPSPSRPVHLQIIAEGRHSKTIVHETRRELIPEGRLIHERRISKRVPGKPLPAAHGVEVPLGHHPLTSADLLPGKLTPKQLPTTILNFCETQSRLISRRGYVFRLPHIPVRRSVTHRFCGALLTGARLH